MGATSIEWTLAEQATFCKRQPIPNFLAQFAASARKPIVKVAVVLGTVARLTRWQNIARRRRAAANDGVNMVNRVCAPIAVRAKAVEQFHDKQMALWRNRCNLALAGVYELPHPLPKSWVARVSRSNRNPVARSASGVANEGKRLPLSAAGAPAKSDRSHAPPFGKSRLVVGVSTTFFAGSASPVSPTAINPKDGDWSPRPALEAPLLTSGDAGLVRIDRNPNAACRDLYCSVSRLCHAFIIGDFRGTDNY